MYEFLSNAFPWIVLGLFIAVSYVWMSQKQK